MNWVSPGFPQTSEVAERLQEARLSHNQVIFRTPIGHFRSLFATNRKL